MTCGEDTHTCTDAVTVRLRTLQTHSQPMVCISSQIDEQQGFVVDIVDNRRHPSFIPKVGNRQTSTRKWFRYTGARLGADVFESSVSLVPIKQSWFVVCRSEFGCIHLGIDVSIDREKI